MAIDRNSAGIECLYGGSTRRSSTCSAVANSQPGAGAWKRANRDFLAGKMPRQESDGNGDWRLHAQYPIAGLVSCFDSRVPPDLLFGRWLGELFIVRNAGNTIDTVAMGSLRNAVAQLIVLLRA